MDEESKAKLENAAKHAKEAAKEVGEVVSDKTSEIGDKWTEMNANRVEETPKEDPNLPTQEGDLGELKERFKAAKDAFLKDPNSPEDADKSTSKEG